MSDPHQPDKHAETPEVISEAGPDRARLTWNVSQSLFRDQVLLKQLAFVFGVTLLVMTILFVVLSWPIALDKLGQLLKLELIVGGILLGLILLAMLLFYGGRYEYRYSLNAQDIERRPRGNTARKNTIANLLLLFSGRPSAMGAGLLAQSRQVESIAWKDVDRAVADSGKKTVTLYRGNKSLMVVACDEEHYETVLRRAQEAAAHPHPARRRS
jgi:hypothetical protein